MFSLLKLRNTFLCINSLLYICLQANENNKPFGEAGPSTSSTAVAVAATSTAARTPAVEEDEVDLQLYRMSGNIQRQRDEKL